ncbi:hypothetical protein BDF19DRAFT_448539 [Syncephalis fuscata]|nr:hypothetical protein BDF19DRAFT_448539 [Syncephalis fuscata]
MFHYQLSIRSVSRNIQRSLLSRNGRTTTNIPNKASITTTTNTHYEQRQQSIDHLSTTNTLNTKDENSSGNDSIVKQSSSSIHNESISTDQPMSAIERQLLKLAMGQRQVYRQVRPAPSFRQVTPSSSSSSLDESTPTKVIPLPNLGVLNNKRLRELDRLKMAVSRINASNHLMELHKQMHHFFSDCTQANLSNVSNSDHADTDTASIAITDRDQLLEAGLRTASRLGNLAYAEALLEQTRRFGMQLYVQMATHRVYRAMIEATWTHTQDAQRIAYWVHEMHRAGIQLDIDTRHLIRKWATTAAITPSFIRSSPTEEVDWHSLSGFERHVKSTEDTLVTLVDKQQQQQQRRTSH